jgi:hypothetical protein
MAPEDLNTLGFSPDVAVKPGAEEADDGNNEVIAGLAAAKRRKIGVIFGLGSGSAPQRGGGH